MLLTITTTHPRATELSYLLHKHPDRFQSFALSFGQAHVFYPEVSDARTTAALLLDVDPVGMVRGRNHGRHDSGPLGQYVNDRPYVASSFLSVAISQVLGTALAGRCKDRPELAEQPLPLTARLEVLPVRAGERLVHRIFEPLGYVVETTRRPLDDQFPQWGESPYFSVSITGTASSGRGNSFITGPGVSLMSIDTVSGLSRSDRLMKRSVPRHKWACLKG